MNLTIDNYIYDLLIFTIKFLPVKLPPNASKYSSSFRIEEEKYSEVFVAVVWSVYIEKKLCVCHRVIPQNLNYLMYLELLSNVSWRTRKYPILHYQTWFAHFPYLLPLRFSSSSILMLKIKFCSNTRCEIRRVTEHGGNVRVGDTRLSY